MGIHARLQCGCRPPASSFRSGSVVVSLELAEDPKRDTVLPVVIFTLAGSAAMIRALRRRELDCGGRHPPVSANVSGHVQLSALRSDCRHEFASRGRGRLVAPNEHFAKCPACARPPNTSDVRHARAVDPFGNDIRLAALVEGLFRRIGSGTSSPIEGARHATERRRDTGVASPRLPRGCSLVRIDGNEEIFPGSTEKFPISSYRKARGMWGERDPRAGEAGRGTAVAARFSWLVS
jgi:hypothetical protein